MYKKKKKNLQQNDETGDRAWEIRALVVIVVWGEIEFERDEWAGEAEP